MKKVMLIFFLFCLPRFAEGQQSFTYTFDSSVLSILMNENGVINAQKPVLYLNLKDKWKYHQTDSVLLDIRGFYMNNEIDTLKQVNIELVYFIARKKYTVNQKPGNFTFSVSITRRSLLKKPHIKIKALGIKQREHDRVTIDSFDLMALANRPTQ